jgi:hypothetical protein
MKCAVAAMPEESAIGLVRIVEAEGDAEVCDFDRHTAS